MNSRLKAWAWSPDAYRALAEAQGLHLLPSLPELIASRPSALTW